MICDSSSVSKSRVCGNCVHYPVREKDGRTCTMTGETVSPYGITCFWFSSRLRVVEEEEAAS